MCIDLDCHRVPAYFILCLFHYFVYIQRLPRIKVEYSWDEKKNEIEKKKYVLKCRSAWALIEAFRLYFSYRLAAYYISDRRILNHISSHIPFNEALQRHSDQWRSKVTAPSPLSYHPHKQPFLSSRSGLSSPETLTSNICAVIICNAS